MAKEALLRAALELIAERGYANLTVADVCMRAGYSRGIVTYHFSSKAALVEDLLDEVFQKGLHMYGADEGTTPIGLDGLNAMIDSFLVGVRQDPTAIRGYSRLILEGLSSADGELADRLRLYSRSVRTMIERPIRRGVEEGLLKPNLDVSAHAAALYGALRGISYQWLLDPDFDVVAALLALKALVASLATEPQ
jgi:AcrR family transcriptional regulator